MRTLIVFGAAVLFATCTGGATTRSNDHSTHSVRYDGFYREDVGGLVYMIRFFREGNVVLINGAALVADSLPPLLTRTAIGNPAMGWYNVPAQFVNDSIFLVTTPERGNIDYRGNMVNDSTLRFERYSHINGDRRIKEYFFKADH